MTVLDEIERRWSSKEQTSLGQNLPEILDLLQQARKINESIPLDLELDIVMTANYVMEYGTTTESLNHISVLWKDGFLKLKNEGSTIDADVARKINRLNSILANSMIGSLLYDTQNNKEETSPSIKLLQGLIDQSRHTENYLDHGLITLALSLAEFLLVAEMNTWYYENISDFITVLSLLEDRNQNISSFLPLIDKIAAKIRGFENEFNFQQWQSTFFEHTERYRFISIMMGNSDPKDSTWRTIAKYFIKD